MTTRHRSSATTLAVVMVALVVYASFFPFEGWRWPPGGRVASLLVLPWPPWELPVDELMNLLGYVPLGLFIAVAGLRGGLRAGTTLVLAVVLPSLLSYAVEVGQHLLPTRHPSAKDWAMNTLGALLGAAFALALHETGWLERWARVRQRWFERGAAGALALLALWPFGLLFPTTVPWGLGQVVTPLRDWLARMLEDVPWARELYETLSLPTDLEPIGYLAERAIGVAGLLAPVLLAYAITRPGVTRLMLAAGALLLGVAGMTLSSLLNFGPVHALAWLTPAAAHALVLAGALALLSAVLPARVAHGLALMVCSALVVLVSHAGTDVYFAHNLQAWEQGRFVRFHGLAQWVGWLWPMAAIGWLLVRPVRRDARSL